MKTINEIIKFCETLYNDLNLSYVKNYKEKHNSKAVGFLPVYIPREIIHSLGMLPVGLMGAGSHLEIIKGDAYFQSYICHIPRSTVELGISGRLDCLDGFIFPAICDVIRNLSGMFKILFTNKYIKYFDLPQNFQKELGGEFYTREISELTSDLSKISGIEISNDSINNSIKLYNENRSLINEIYNLRDEKPYLVPTHELYLLMRASNILEVSEHTKLLKEYLSKIVTESRPKRDNIRVILTGAFCEQPPLALIRTLESSGCQIVDDDWVLGARFLRADVEISNNPLKSLAEAYLNNTVTTASKYEETKKGKDLVTRYKKLNAEGVIFAAPSFCDPALLEQPMQKKALELEKIPYTSFKYSEDTGQFQVIKEQTGTFTDSIKLWEHNE